MIMACTHVAHNCLLADHVNVANNVILAGHIEVGPRAFISGAVVMQQFVRVGTLAMVGAQARIPKDIPPYCMIGKGSVVSGANVIGLKRAEIGPSARTAIRSALRQIYFSADTLPTQAVEQVCRGVRRLPRSTGVWSNLFAAPSAGRWRQDEGRGTTRDRGVTQGQVDP